MDLNQITAPVINLEEAIAFYQKLGLLLIVHVPAKYARFELPEGNATFSLHKVDQLPNGSGVVIYFEVENLDEKVELLQTEGIEFELLPTDQFWLWREAVSKTLRIISLSFIMQGQIENSHPGV